MMNLEDYANDVNKTVEEIKKLCDKLEIEYENEESMLSQNDITVLDNYLDEEEPTDSDNELDYEADDKAEELAMNTKFDLDDQKKFEKVKSRATKKAESNKKDFLKERKKIYKHRDKLQSNENAKDENVILYKDGMTVNDLAAALNVSGIEIVKKLMGLGVMASVNQNIDYDSAEIIVS